MIEIAPQRSPASTAQASVSLRDETGHSFLARTDRPGLDTISMVPQGPDALALADEVSGRRESSGTPTPGALTLNQEFQRLYDRINLRVSSDTFPSCTDSDLEGPVRTLGSGKCHTTYSMSVRGPNGHPVERVFKPLQPVERGWVADKIGIDLSNPQTAMRNLATVAYAKKLGFGDLVVDTTIGVIGGSGRLAGGLQVGLVMEKAPGRMARRCDAPTLQRPDVILLTTRLQWLDGLAGQGDRSSRNYFVDVRAEKARISAIDNDQCFGARLTDPNDARHVDTDDGEGFQGVLLPPIVDSVTKKAIENLTEVELREMLGPLLTDEEVDAAVARLAKVKDHLKNRCDVVDPEDFRGTILEKLNPENSYAKRDLAIVHKQWSLI